MIPGAATEQPFQRLLGDVDKPLKRFFAPTPSLHRAEAAVLMRGSKGYAMSRLQRHNLAGPNGAFLGFAKLHRTDAILDRDDARRFAGLHALNDVAQLRNVTIVALAFDVTRRFARICSSNREKRDCYRRAYLQ